MLTEVPFRDIDNQIGHLSIAGGAQQFSVLCVSPHQWHGRARWPSTVHINLGLVRTRIAKILECIDGPWFTTMEFEAKRYQRRPSSGLRDGARQPGTAP